MTKNKFKNTIASLLFLLAINITAQETIKVPLSNPAKEGHLKMGIINGSIKVKGYTGKEVIVTGTRRVSGDHYNYHESKRSKKGLKRISNNSLEFSATEYDNVVRVKSPVHITVDFEIKVPTNFSLKISTINNGDIYVENVNGTMDVSNKNGKITLSKVSGSVSADTLNGDLVIDFVKVTPNVAMAFSNLNGDIDVTFPKTIKADVKVKSDRGEVYTDFDLKTKPSQKAKVTKGDVGNGKAYRVKVEKWITGSINGGGAEILFKNFHGDVIIRAK
jgi:DUF4097 and DUF4098 domain-containing protein YvlB